MTGISLASKLGENLIINPTFDLWQRNTTFTSIVSGNYFADRFQYWQSGAAVHDINRSTDVPTISESGFPNTYSAFLNTTTLDASVDAGDATLINYKIEGYDFRKVSGKNIYMSFWVKSTKTGIHCVAFQNGVPDRSYVVEYTINTTNTWEKKTIRLQHDSTGTWDYTSSIGLMVYWTLGAGATFQTTADTWQTGNFFATANQVNGVDAVNNEFRLAQVQLHEGIDEIPFNRLARDFATELQMCQRYFEKTWNIGTAVGTNTLTGTHHINGFSQASAKDVVWCDEFTVNKRSTPTMTMYDQNGVINKITNMWHNSTPYQVAMTGVVGTERNFTFGQGNPSNTAGMRYHYTADAEL